MTTIVEPDITNKIWNTWAETQFKDDQWAVWPRNVATIHKRHTIYQNFEAWLFYQGGYLTRVDKQVYIKFLNDKRATLFLLKHA